MSGFDVLRSPMTESDLGFEIAAAHAHGTHSDRYHGTIMLKVEKKGRHVVQR